MRPAAGSWGGRPLAVAMLVLLVAIIAKPVPARAAAGTWQHALQPRDIDGDGVTDAHFDVDLGVTWIADLAIASPNRYTPRDDGQMMLSNARGFASQFVLHGVSGWRLPKTNFSGYGVCEFDVDGGGVCGYHADPSSSELAHMFFVTLGGTGFPDAGHGLGDTGPFIGLRAISYWSDTSYHYLNSGFAFSMASGVQNWANTGNELGVWLVRDGDVRSVPAPATLALVVAGIALLPASSGWRRLSTVLRAGAVD